MNFKDTLLGGVIILSFTYLALKSFNVKQLVSLTWETSTVVGVFLGILAVEDNCIRVFFKLLGNVIMIFINSFVVSGKEFFFICRNIDDLSWDTSVGFLIVDIFRVTEHALLGVEIEDNERIWAFNAGDSVIEGFFFRAGVDIWVDGWLFSDVWVGCAFIEVGNSFWLFVFVGVVIIEFVDVWSLGALFLI